MWMMIWPRSKVTTTTMQLTMQVVLTKAFMLGEKWTCTECDYQHKRRGYVLNHIEREHMDKDFPGYACLRCQHVRKLNLSIQKLKKESKHCSPSRLIRVVMLFIST